MKITIDIDCSPQEARTLMGLPDVTPLNQAIMDEMERKVRENLDQYSDPQKFYQSMIEAGTTNMEALAKLFGAAGEDAKSGE